MHWSQRSASCQNSSGVRKRHSTSPSYQLPKGFSRAIPYHFPTPSSCSGQLGRQRAPSTFPSTALPAPSSSSPPPRPLHPNTQTQHPQTVTLVFSGGAAPSRQSPLTLGYFFPGTAHSPIPSFRLCIPRNPPKSIHPHTHPTQLPKVKTFTSLKGAPREGREAGRGVGTASLGVPQPLSGPSFRAVSSFPKYIGIEPISLVSTPGEQVTVCRLNGAPGTGTRAEGARAPQICAGSAQSMGKIFISAPTLSPQSGPRQLEP